MSDATDPKPLTREQKLALLAQRLRKEVKVRILPLSFAQQRLWLFDQLDPGNPSYNMATVAALDGAVDVPTLERSLGALSTLELSQGQRKRLALLTAYLEDRPVYIFDEWAADQDPMFKEVFYKEIVPDLKRRGKAVLVISHDDRYFQLADRIIHLESGQIVADTRPAAGQRVGT